MLTIGWRYISDIGLGLCDFTQVFQTLTCIFEAPVMANTLRSTPYILFWSSALKVKIYTRDFERSMYCRRQCFTYYKICSPTCTACFHSAFPLVLNALLRYVYGVKYIFN